LAAARILSVDRPYGKMRVIRAEMPNTKVGDTCNERTEIHPINIRLPLGC
jgi:hypothetical protein